MKKDMDKIQFEYRYEVQELMKVLIEYAKSPSVPALGLFYSILERVA